MLVWSRNGDDVPTFLAIASQASSSVEGWSSPITVVEILKSSKQFSDPKRLGLSVSCQFSAVETDPVYSVRRSRSFGVNSKVNVVCGLAQPSTGIQISLGLCLINAKTLSHNPIASIHRDLGEGEIKNV